MLKQKTLRGSFSLNGKGLHTGVNLNGDIQSCTGQPRV